MSRLPSGWAVTAIDEIAETSLGKMLDKKKATGKHPTPYLRNVNVRWGFFDLSDVASMDIRPEELERVLARPGDVIVCEGGEPGRAAVWRRQPVALQKALHRLRPTNGVVPEYLAFFLWHMAASRQLERFCTGTTIRHLPQEKLRQIPVPLPALAEQERIVATIEEHFSGLDAADSALRSARRRLNLLEETIYRSALQVDAPHRPLADVATTISGGTPKRSRPDFYGGVIPWIKSGELGDGVVTSTEETISEEGLASSSAKLVPEGTILIAMYGATIGRMGRVGFDQACTNQAVASVFPGPEITPDYLWNVLRAKRRELVREGQGGAQPNISQTILRRLAVPIPSRDEQAAVCADIERVLSLWSNVAHAVVATEERVRRLRAATLAAAFRGELVQQDPSDEPASVLLERIREERASVPRNTRRTKRAPA